MDEYPLTADTTRPRPTHGIFFSEPLGVVEDNVKQGGLQSLLKPWGYCVEFDSDERDGPRGDFLLLNLQNPWNSVGPGRAG